MTTNNELHPGHPVEKAPCGRCEALESAYEILREGLDSYSCTCRWNGFKGAADECDKCWAIRTSEEVLKGAEGV